MAYPNTGSTLTHADGKNKTSTASSTNIIIKVNGQAVGAVQNLRINENRPITMVNEIGTDGSIDSLPTASTTIGGSCSRIRFDRLRVAEAFSRNFIHPSAQVFPFDIVIYDIQNGDEDSDTVIATIIKNVWIESIDYSYDAGNWIITDNMGWKAEHIFSYVGNPSVSVAQGGERNITPETYNSDELGHTENIESATDRAQDGRRGSFDISSILRIVGNGQ